MCAFPIYVRFNERQNIPTVDKRDEILLNCPPVAFVVLQREASRRLRETRPIIGPICFAKQHIYAHWSKYNIVPRQDWIDAENDEVDAIYQDLVEAASKVFHALQNLENECDALLPLIEEANRKNIAFLTAKEVKPNYPDVPDIQ